MGKNAVVVLAPGFEEIEAVTCIDILRRAGIQVRVIALDESLTVRGSHDITLEADGALSALTDVPDAVVLPGGMPGAENLMQSAAVEALVRSCLKADKIVAAICAAPACVLAAKGFLDGRHATCYPGMEQHFGPAAIYEDAPVVIDGNIITANGPGSALLFAVSLVELLTDERQAALVRRRALVA